MNLPLHIAKRYIFAKKSHNAINVISGISVAGVTVGTMALVIVLSVFNGFDDVIQKLFNSFDPDIKITIAEGKTFRPEERTLEQLSRINGIEAWSRTVEENALLKYGEKQYIATIKGVDNNYARVNGIDSMIVDGSFNLKDNKGEYAVIGGGIAYYLQIGLNFVTPIIVYLPRKEASLSMVTEQPFNHRYIFPSGIFAIEQEHDTKYVIVPINFAYDLLEDSLSISSIEVKIAGWANADKIQSEINKLFGPTFKVQNRYQQQELFYKIMKYEKWAIFMILTFILIIASFNIIGSLSMLIIEKKKDITILNNLGANHLLIRRVFLYEGLMITTFGAFLGVVLGLIICWLQITFGFLQLQGSGSFIIDAYPVSVKFMDICMVFVTVMGIGYLTALFPVKFIINKYLPDNKSKN